MSFFDNLSYFHFLRPFWLLGLFVLPIIYIAMRKRALSNSDWSNAIDPTLLKHLLPSNQQQNKQNRHFGMLAVLSFSFIAMAGPAWQEKPQEVVKLTDNMVVVLDLSLSMLATDTAPDRLTRSKQKLQDLLKLRKEGYTALIAFSGDSHVVTPLTDDTKTILANLPALDPFIMPVIGSRPDLAVKQAVDLLKQGKANQGRIILLTDSVEPHHIERITKTLAGTNTNLHVLAIGTAAGGPIKLPEKGYLKDEGNVVIPKTDFASLAKLANQNRGQMLRMTLDDKDLERLDIEGSLSLNQEKDKPTLEKGFDAWKDMGFLFVILMIPLALRAHRQGVMLQISLLLSLFLLPVEDSLAFGWDDLWQTQDQQAQKLLDEGNFFEAAERFDSLEHKANANYKAKQFEKASEQYAQSENEKSYYNQGNAFAHQQKFEEAIKSYDQALEINPDNEDAQHNKTLIEEFLKQKSESSDPQQDSENKDKQDQDQQNSDDQQSKDKQEQSDQEKKDQKSSEDKQDQEQEKSEQEQKEEQDKSDQASQDQKNKQEEQAKSEEQKQAEKEQEAKASEMPEPEDLTDEEKQSYEQWMRRVPDDPGGLLRRKFEQQSRDRNRNTREAGEPIW